MSKISTRLFFILLFICTAFSLAEAQTRPVLQSWTCQIIKGSTKFIHSEDLRKEDSAGESALRFAEGGTLWRCNHNEGKNTGAQLSEGECRYRIFCSNNLGQIYRPYFQGSARLSDGQIIQVAAEDYNSALTELMAECRLKTAKDAACADAGMSFTFSPAGRFQPGELPNIGN